MTWVSAGNPEIPNDRIVAAIISGRRSRAHVLRVAEELFVQRYYYTSDIISTLYKNRNLEVKGGYPGHVIVGHNPFLFARMVENLRTTPDVENERETISWTECVVYRNAAQGSGVEVAQDATEEKLSRPYRPLVSW